MIDFSAFFTLPNGVSGNNQTPMFLGDVTKQIKPSEAGLPSQDFMNLFLKNALETLEHQKTTTPNISPEKTENVLLQSDNPALSQADALSLLKTLAANEDIAEHIAENSEIFDTTIIQDIEQTLHLNAKAFEDIIHALKVEQTDIDEIAQGFDAFTVNDVYDLIQKSDENGVYEAEGLIAAVLAKHEALAQSANAGTINLTPEHITKALAKAEDMIARVGNKTDIQTDTQEAINTESFDALLQSLAVVIQPVQAVQNVPTAQAQTVQQPVSTEVLAIVSSALALPAAVSKPLQTHLSTTEQPVLTDGEIVIPDVENAASKPLNIKPVSAKEATQILKALTFNTLTPGFTDSSLAASDASFQNYMDDLPPILKAETSPLTQSITQSSVRAGQSHPATQMVAMTMRKNATDGTPKNMTLQLDPPELGRVEVKMQFDKTSKMKTLMVVEKPETLALLQRDAQSLERAMGDIGIDADGAMEFSLADDGHFDQEGRHDGSRNQASGKTGTEDARIDTEILETQMDWSVDPHTGHIRYSIWA